jgi:hypothetical protein
MKGKTGQNPLLKRWGCAQCFVIVLMPTVKAQANPYYGRSAEFLHICH